MDQCTHEVRMQHWMNVVSQCQNREEGTSIKQWLKDHGIRHATYYLWQRRIRQEAYAQMEPSATGLPAVQDPQGIVFAEVPVPAPAGISPAPAEPFPSPAAVIRTASMTIALSADIPDGLLTRILREVGHA